MGRPVLWRCSAIADGDRRIYFRFLVQLAPDFHASALLDLSSIFHGADFFLFNPSAQVQIDVFSDGRRSMPVAQSSNFR